MPYQRDRLSTAFSATPSTYDSESLLMDIPNMSTAEMDAIIKTAERMEAAAIDPNLSEEERNFWWQICYETADDVPMKALPKR